MDRYFYAYNMHQGDNKMEKLKTRNEYVGCNRKARFYADEIRATSYDHWNFVNVINGKVVFNWFKYSNTTSNHQWAVNALLQDLGIKVDVTVNMNRSLTEDTFRQDALHYYYNTATQLIVKKNSPRVRKKTKEECEMALENIREKIKELKELGAEYSWRSLYRSYKRDKAHRDDKEKYLVIAKKLKKNKDTVYRDKLNRRWVYNSACNKRESVEMRCLDERQYGTVYSQESFDESFKVCKLSTALNA